MSSLKRACIVLPTYNEAENIRVVLMSILRVTRAMKQWRVDVLVVDDNSPDGTASIVKSVMRSHRNVHVLSGTKQGLGVAYVRGFRFAMKEFSPDVLFEMDADLSHPPELIPVFLRKIDEGADVVVGSRYVRGGGTPDWGVGRKVISRGGNFFARVVAGLYHVRDCTSGFRAISTKLIRRINLGVLGAKGYSFQMNLLYECVRIRARIVEVPLVFFDRMKGSSKMRTRDLVEFFVNSFKLRLRTWERFVKFCVVGGTGVLVNMGLLFLLTELALLPYQLSSLFAIQTAIVWNFFLNNRWTFRDSKNTSSTMTRLLKFNATSVVGALINWGVLVALTELAAWHYLVANLLGIVVATAWNYLVNRAYTWRE